MKPPYVVGGLGAAAIVAGASIYGICHDRPPAVITLLGVVAAAIVTLLAASHRLDRQLEHARSQHEKDLAHDRQLADLADLRQVLDNAAKALQEGAIAFEAVQSEHSGVAFAHRDYAKRARNDAVRCSVALRGARARLLVRLGHDDELEEHLEKAHDLLQATIRLARDMRSPVRDPVEIHGEILKRNAAYVVEERAFISAAVTRVGVAVGLVTVA